MHAPPSGSSCALPEVVAPEPKNEPQRGAKGLTKEVRMPDMDEVDARVWVLEARRRHDAFVLLLAQERHEALEALGVDVAAVLSLDEALSNSHWCRQRMQDALKASVRAAPCL